MKDLEDLFQQWDHRASDSLFKVIVAKIDELDNGRDKLYSVCRLAGLLSLKPTIDRVLRGNWIEHARVSFTTEVKGPVIVDTVSGADVTVDRVDGENLYLKINAEDGCMLTLFLDEYNPTQCNVFKILHALGVSSFTI